MKTVWIAEVERPNEAPVKGAFYDREKAILWVAKQFRKHDPNDNPRVMRYEDSVTVASIKYYDLLAAITSIHIVED